MRIDWHKTVDFIRKDWHSNPLRLSLEVFNWIMNFVIAMTFTITMPNVPFLVVYPMFFLCLSISMYSAASRGSFGLLMTSLTIFVIDLVGYYRLLMLQ
jgi:hypothetical protein